MQQKNSVSYWYHTFCQKNIGNKLAEHFFCFWFSSHPTVFVFTHKPSFRHHNSSSASHRQSQGGGLFPEGAFVGERYSCAPRAAMCGFGMRQAPWQQAQINLLRSTRTKLFFCKILTYASFTTAVVIILRIPVLRSIRSIVIRIILFQNIFFFVKVLFCSIAHRRCQQHSSGGGPTPARGVKPSPPGVLSLLFGVCLYILSAFRCVSRHTT